MAYPTKPTVTKVAWTDGDVLKQIEPSSGKKTLGWISAEKPPFQWMNWLLYSLGLWDTYFDSAIDELKTLVANIQVNLWAPANTKMLFYQASPPSGWVRDTSANDRFIRVVSGGTPGATGGTHAASMNIGTHTHPMAHTHGLTAAKVALFQASGFWRARMVADQTSAWQENYRLNGTTPGFVASNIEGYTQVYGSTDGVSTANTTGASIGTGGYAYADVMIATKS